MKFSVLISATGKLEPDLYEATLHDLKRVLDDLNLPYNISKPGDSEYTYLSENNPNSWWAEVRDLTFSGIIDKSQIKEIIDAIGAMPSGCQTLGTLGGPLGLGICWDIDLAVDSGQLLVCFRVTPLPEYKGQIIETCKDPEKLMSRLERAFNSTFN